MKFEAVPLSNANRKILGHTYADQMYDRGKWFDPYMECKIGIMYEDLRERIR
jgi:hypothetical protein